MSRRLEDEELDRLLKEEYLNEADELKDILLSEDDLSDQKLYTDEEIHASYGKLVERLKAEGAYREDEDESQEKPDPGKNRYGSMVKQHRIAKAAGFVIVCFLGVLAASMTSEANRNYVVKTFKYLSSDEPNVIVDNDQENERPDMSEEEARKDIEDQLGVAVPVIMYRPEGFEYSDYYIYESAMTATIEYCYEENIIALFFYKENEKTDSNNWNASGDGIDQISFSGGDMNADIFISEDESEISDGEECYIAQWGKDGWIYQFSGRMSLEEFEKIIKNLQF